MEELPVLRPGVPIYLQIVEWVKYGVAEGALKAGDALPPIRSLAERVGVNLNTVGRAYRELEREGLVVARPPLGTFITGAGSPLAARERRRIATERVDALLAELRHLGITVEQLHQLIDERDKILAVRLRDT